MSDSLAVLHRQIGNTEDLRAVVKTMKAMSAASITQFEQAAAALEDYHRAVELALSLGVQDVPLPEESRRPTRPGLIVIGTDQGMAGQFNEHVVEAVTERVTGAPADPGLVLWVVGERAQARLENASHPATQLFPTPQGVEAIAPLISELLVAVERAYTLGQVGKVEICHNAPVLRGNYDTCWERLLPLDRTWQDQLRRIPWPTRCRAELIPGGALSWPALVSEFLFVSLYRAVAESCAAENAARLAAMQRAEKNIDDRRRDLDLRYNHLRQSTIDEELFDLVAGFEALTRRPGP